MSCGSNNVIHKLESHYSKFYFNQAKLELWEIRQYHERIEREKALEREKKEQEEALKRAAELRAAALQRKQQEQQARQQQQHLLKINKKKVQNAIKTQQRKVTVLKPATANSSVTYKPAVTPPVPPGVLRRTLPVVGPTVPTKLQGIQSVSFTSQVRTQIAPRTTMNTAASPTAHYAQRLQPKPQVTQRIYTVPATTAAVTASHTSRVKVPVTSPGYTG